MKELPNIRKIDSLLLIREFVELNGKSKESNEIPDADQSECFRVTHGVKVKTRLEMQSV